MCSTGVLDCSVLQTLSELQDRLPPFPTEIALQLIQEDLGQPVSAIMSTITPQPVAAASLGQVSSFASTLPPMEPECGSQKSAGSG